MCAHDADGAAMLRVMLVDDEPPARRGLKRLLAEHADLSVVAEAGSLAEAVKALSEARPDIVFLDVELGDGKGFEILGQSERRPDVVFVTAYSRYAVRAFDVAAADFLVKPVNPERLALTLDRLRQRRAAKANEASAVVAPEKRKLLLNLPRMRLIVPLKSVLLLEADGDFTRVITADGGEQMICRLLGQFQAELPSPPFHRLSRSMIVNLDQVRRLEWTGGGRAEIAVGRSNRTVKLGRAAARRLREAGLPG